jgi:hypothetical protein
LGPARGFGPESAMNLKTGVEKKETKATKDFHHPRQAISDDTMNVKLSPVW